MATKKCPVCDWEITDGGIKVKVGDKEITVCCDDCARKRRARQSRLPGRAPPVRRRALQSPGWGRQLKARFATGND